MALFTRRYHMGGFYFHRLKPLRDVDKMALEISERIKKDGGGSS